MKGGICKGWGWERDQWGGSVSEWKVNLQEATSVEDFSATESFDNTDVSVSEPVTIINIYNYVYT